jgi:hypothetical protein
VWVVNEWLTVQGLRITVRLAMMNGFAGMQKYKPVICVTK